MGRVLAGDGAMAGARSGTVLAATACAFARRHAVAEGAADAGGRAEGRLEEVDPLPQRSGGSESEPGKEVTPEFLPYLSN